MVKETLYFISYFYWQQTYNILDLLRKTNENISEVVASREAMLEGAMQVYGRQLISVKMSLNNALQTTTINRENMFIYTEHTI